MVLKIDTTSREQRFKFLAGLVIAIFVLLVLRLWMLQIMQGASNTITSRQNQSRTIPIGAPRGIFYDRQGQALATNRVVRQLLVVPEDISAKPAKLALLSRITGLTEAEILTKLRPDSAHPRIAYQYVTLINDLPTPIMLRLLEHKLDLPGVEVNERPIRYYPYQEFASHLFGYLREIDQTELQKLKDKQYHSGDRIGKTGLERTYEAELRGQNGAKVFEVDSRGRQLRLLEKREVVPGNNLHLTIDQRLQAVAEAALTRQIYYLQTSTRYRNASSGAVVVLDPRTGQILAMTSKPGYDPNRFEGVLSEAETRRLYDSRLYPLLNRATRGEYSPGSVFKPITVIAALAEHKADFKQHFYCSGADPIYPKYFKCWIFDDRIGSGGHGTQNIVAGIKNSCNIVMADLSRKLGPDNLARYSRHFGLGRPTGLNLYPQEEFGFVPDPDWKRRNTKEQKWYPLETMHFGIGQGYLTTTPLQLAQVYAAIANNGRLFRPYLVTRISDASGRTLQRFKPRLAEDLKFSPEIMTAVRQGLLGVVREGTAAPVFQGFPLGRYPVAGKTGTVQKLHYDNFGVFACFAPADRPEIVVIVLIEQGGAGSLAAPVARQILEAYFEPREREFQNSLKTSSKNVTEAPGSPAPTTPVVPTPPGAVAPGPAPTTAAP